MTPLGFKQRITVKSIELIPLRAKGGVSPNMALGGMPTRPALLIRVWDSDGCFGWGEVWANFPPRASLHKAHLIEDVVAPKLTGLSFVEPRECVAQLRSALSVYFLHIGQKQVFEHILAGVDTALWDLALRKADVSFAEFQGLDSSSVPTYASSINVNDLDRLLPHHIGLGQQHFKLKIGFMDRGDLDLVARAAALCPSGTRIMVDSNQSWSLDQAVETLHALEQFDPLFAEESLVADAGLADWEALARATRIPLAGGENIYGVEAFVSMANAGMQYLQPDVAKWGGVSGALELVAALPENTKLWPHFMGSAVGQCAALAVTAAVGHGAVCEVDVNDNLLRTGLCGDVLNIDNGCIPLFSGSGLVPEPVAEQLDTFGEPL